MVKPMKRIVAVAKGDVQRVGYRDEVERVARELGITGYVENLKPYDIRIVAEGDEEKLKLFVERVKIRKYPIFVESIEVSWQDATGEFSFFEIRRGEWTEELFERLDAAGRLLYRTVELGERSVELGEKNVGLSEAILGATKEESEKTRNLIKDESEKTRSVIEEESEKTRNLIKEESEETRSVIKGESERTREEIRLLRIDLREYIEESLKEIRVKILEMENALRKAGIM